MKKSELKQKFHLHSTIVDAFGKKWIPATRRSWPFYVFLISFSVLFLGYLLWQFTPLKDEVEARMIKFLQPYLGESFYITDFSISPNSVSFYNVHTGDINANYSLDIGEIRVGFNPAGLLQRVIMPGQKGGKLTRSIQTAAIINPRLTIYYTGVPRQKTNFSLDKVSEEILNNLKENFPEIDFLRIRNGEVLLQLPWSAALPEGASVVAERQIPLITGLRGRLNYLSGSDSDKHPALSDSIIAAGMVAGGGKTTPGEIITLKLQGDLFGVENSLVKLTGTADFSQKRFEATLNLDESFVTSHLPFWKFNFWQIDNARLQGEVHISNYSNLNMNVHPRTLALDSLSFYGDVTVKNMDMRIYGQRAIADSFYLRFRHQDVQIDTFTCKVEEGDARFGGMIYNIFEPRAEWHLKVKNYPVKYLKQSHSIFEYAYEGKMTGAATFTGPFKSLDIHAEAFCPELLYAVVPFNTVQTRLVYNTRERILRFPYLRADFFEFTTRGFGEVNFTNDSLDFDLKSSIEVPEGYFTLLNGLNGGEVRLETDFYGNFITKKFRGGFRYVGLGKDTLLVTGQGPFTLTDQHLDFTVHTDESGDQFTVKGTIEHLFSGPEFRILEFRDFPVHQLSYHSLVKGFLEGRHTNLYFSGPYYSLAARLKIVPEDYSASSPKIAEMSGTIKDIFLDNQRYMFDFIVHSAPQKIRGALDAAFSAGGVDVRVQSPGLFTGALHLSAAPDGPITGALKIAPAELAAYLQNSPAWAKIFQEGRVGGTLQIEGQMDNPRLDFDFSAEDLVLNGVGYYRLRVAGRQSDQLLKFRNLYVSLNGDTVLTAGLRWNRLTNNLDLTARGSRLESNFLAETIFGDRNLIRGSLDYAISASGSLSRPAVQGRATIQNGFFLGENPFRTISLAFSDSVTAEGNFWNINHHLVRIENFLYRSRTGMADSIDWTRREYDITGRGLIGIFEHSPIDLELRARGNVLAELPRLQPYFIEPKVNGDLYVHVKGSRLNPYIEEVDLNIYDGSMRFDGVIPRVTGLKADVELTNASDFVRIKTFEGKVDGHWARIYNLPRVTVADREPPELQPWRFEEIGGINFGILVLETGEKGIPLNFPGMMEGGDIGYFAAAGKLPGEKFYLAGPPEQPLCRGTLRLYNCRVTFPFIGMYDESGEYAYEDNNKVIAFLMNMEWDLKALPGNNNRYFVKIPGYVGEVFMDLNIDNASEGLEFTGRLIDESFRVDGSVYSTRGRVEYLDVNFRVERFGAEFNPYEIYPEVYGSAFTTVRTEPNLELTDNTEAVNAVGERKTIPRDIYLELYVIDPVTGQEVSKGRWEDFRFKLVSRDNVFGETEEDILAHLGYSFQNLQSKAGEVGVTLTQNFLIRPLFRPIERQLERKLHLDYVRLRSNFASHLLYLSFQDRTNFFASPTFLLINKNLDPALQLLQSSELTLGKYVFKDVYMSYSGQLIAGFEESKLGVNHTMGLEFRLPYDWLLEVEVSRFQFDPFYFEESNEQLRKRNISVRLRRSFSF